VKDEATHKPDPVMQREVWLNASIFSSQEIMSQISDVPSERVETTTFISWNTDSQDAPKIDWDSAVCSSGVKGNSNKETKLHRSLQALLKSQMSKKSEGGTAQDTHNDGTCCDARESRSPCVRLASTTFLSWSSVAGQSSEEVDSAMPVPHNWMQPKTRQSINTLQRTDDPAL